MARFPQLLLPDAQRLPLDEVLDRLDLDHGDRISRRSGFLIMLTLSAVIATAGVLADSTATVIGAMIIAPLSTPILGIAIAIVAGRARRLGRSLLWLAGGAAGVVLLGAIMSLLVADPASLGENSQIAGRTSPQLLDLLAALATGFAGSLALARRDLAAVLPGVAISISLVPPLGVAGVCLGRGAVDLALGAILLFVSNVLALVIAGAVVFSIAGYAREARRESGVRRGRAYAIVAVLTLLVAVPLALQTLVGQVATQWRAEALQKSALWLVGTPGARVLDVEWEGLALVIQVQTSDGEIPAVSELAPTLEAIPAFIPVEVEITTGRVVEVR